MADVRYEWRLVTLSALRTCLDVNFNTSNLNFPRFTIIPDPVVPSPSGLGLSWICKDSKLRSSDLQLKDAC